MAIDWKSGIRTGLTMAAGQILAKVVGKRIGLNEEQIRTAEYLGIGVGMGIGLNTDDGKRDTKKSSTHKNSIPEDEKESYHFRNAVQAERERGQSTTRSV